MRYMGGGTSYRIDNSLLHHLLGGKGPRPRVVPWYLPPLLQMASEGSPVQLLAWFGVGKPQAIDMASQGDVQRPLPASNFSTFSALRVSALMDSARPLARP